ncbi:MAG: hypothetical protein D6675_16040 [Gemmatimonadetes bacterium]|nr:MAG: hypothetical protein D6675_16040 [Gemmatimonadota bacterium]
MSTFKATLLLLFLVLVMGVIAGCYTQLKPIALTPVINGDNPYDSNYSDDFHNYYPRSRCIDCHTYYDYFHYSYWNYYSDPYVYFHYQPRWWRDYYWYDDWYYWNHHHKPRRYYKEGAYSNRVEGGVHIGDNRRYPGDISPGNTLPPVPPSGPIGISSGSYTGGGNGNDANGSSGNEPPTALPEKPANGGTATKTAPPPREKPANTPPATKGNSNSDNNGSGSIQPDQESRPSGGTGQRRRRF